MNIEQKTKDLDGHELRLQKERLAQEWLLGLEFESSHENLANDIAWNVLNQLSEINKKKRQDKKTKS